MNDEDSQNKENGNNPEDETGTPDGTSGEEYSETPAQPGVSLGPEQQGGQTIPPVSGAPGYQASPLGYGWTPEGGGWQAGPRKKSIFRDHPILLAALFLLTAVALVVILGMAAGGGGESKGLGFGGAFGKKVGVVKVEGLIVESKEVVDQIHRFRDDESVAAVVLRIDSPGGTVGASQEISEEVKKLADKKPVVVSMGGVAASGGYYIACPASTIMANPGTITGSIGVVMEITNLKDLLNWMKIDNYVIKSGEYKDAGSPYRDLDEDERELFQEIVDSMHAQFEETVAEGRGMDPEKVSELADGRIYNGKQAMELGLVDELGNLWDAIDKAGELGGIKGKPNVIWPPSPRPTILGGLFGNLLPGWRNEAALLPGPVRVMYVMDVR